MVGVRGGRRVGWGVERGVMVLIYTVFMTWLLSWGVLLIRYLCVVLAIAIHAISTKLPTEDETETSCLLNAAWSAHDVAQLCSAACLYN